MAWLIYDQCALEAREGASGKEVQQQCYSLFTPVVQISKAVAKKPLALNYGYIFFPIYPLGIVALHFYFILCELILYLFFFFSFTFRVSLKGHGLGVKQNCLHI